MASPAFLLPLDGSLDGVDVNGAFTATSSGTLAYDTGALPDTQGASITIAGATTIHFSATDRIAQDAGAMAFWFRRSSDPGVSQYLFHIGQGVSGADYFHGRVFSNDAIQSFWQTNGGAQRILTNGLNPTVGQDVFYYTEWDGTAVRMFNSFADTTVTSTRDAPAGSWGTQGNLYIGSLSTGSGQLDGVIGPVMGFSAPLTDDEVAQLQAATAWSFDMFASAPPRTIHPVLKIGSSHIGPLRVGERN